MSASFLLGILAGTVFYRSVKWWIRTHFGGPTDA